MFRSSLDTSIKPILCPRKSGPTQYLAKLDAVDREEPEIRAVTGAEIQQKIATMEAKMAELKVHEAAVAAHPDAQVSLTDPDARSMMKTGGVSCVGYNVQTAVDSKHHLIAAHEVTNAPIDRRQLSPMATQVKAALKGEALTVIADPGYYKSEEIAACTAASESGYLREQAYRSLFKGRFSLRRREQRNHLSGR